MTVFKHETDTQGGVPVYVIVPGYTPCKLTKPGEQIRARTVQKGEQLVCPRCERTCAVPHSIGPGNEFVVFRHPKTAKRGK
ncbi:hypothetical protein [Desulfocurvibacter africanus]|uniref:Uncharacterized protein n=1 Tax=Desulfocurvibacter africanus subsp. africanus str. Walvis Bay TaxID=690850 RepID=F3YVZ2_DESAF|nr:hypothetical protein [Desulfocurvibacter africanus]EGJ49022.1 hypothetical protein Desaf_0670 [Desulfocurvibacter africanus subsp. africanus str. Walvis Bay]